MARFELGLALAREEVYSFTPNDGTETITIWSGRLRQWLRENVPDKVIELTFPEQTLDEIIEQHGLEAPRLASMTEEEATDPVVIGLWPGGTHILIDGGHRRAFWAKRGVNILSGWAVPYKVWTAFQVDFNDPAMVAAYHAPDGSLLPQRQGKE